MSGHAASADNNFDGAGRTESDSYSDEEQQNQLTQLTDGRELRRWITRREWTDYIQEDHLRNRRSCVVSIFRVPNLLKDIKKELYVPQRVSLGPYHHRSAELPPMGHHKGRALQRMMTRFKNNMNPVIELNNMDFANSAMEEILKLENDIRNSYEENIDCNGKTLARMLSLDGCFLLEVLRTVGGDGAEEMECYDPIFGKNKLRTVGGDGAEEMECYDPIFGKNKLGFAATDIMLDILMLENQIPLVVLRKLLELELKLERKLERNLELNSPVNVELNSPVNVENVELNSPVNVEKVLLKVLVRATSGLFTSLYDEDIDIEQLLGPRPIEEKFHHLLGFLHTLVASPPSSTQDQPVEQDECIISIGCCISECIRMLQGKGKAPNDAESIPHATELRNVGIKFSPLKTRGIKAIRFEQKSATIFLPRISIMDETEIIFRNLIAFEVCKPSEINYVTCYVTLMDELIDSEQDVALLSRMGVLTHGLGSDKDVADLFNGLLKGVTESPGGLLKGVTESQGEFFQKLRKDVNEHYKSKIKVHFARLVQHHFSSPWKVLALAAAVVLLLLAAVQTIFSIISVYKSH